MRACITLLFVLALSLLVACSGESPAARTGPADIGDGQSPTTGAGSMSARVGGSAWSSSGLTSAGYRDFLLVITGTDGSTPPRAITLTVFPTGPGTYDMDRLETAASGKVQIGADTWHASAATGGDGSITITTLTETGASGTFSFEGFAVAGSKAAATKKVTDGAFKVRFARSAAGSTR